VEGARLQPCRSTSTSRALAPDVGQQDNGVKKAGTRVPACVIGVRQRGAKGSARQSSSEPCCSTAIAMATHSSTKIFFFAHISFRIFGHTLTVTTKAAEVPRSLGRQATELLISEPSATELLMPLSAGGATRSLASASALGTEPERLESPRGTTVLPGPRDSPLRDGMPVVADDPGEGPTLCASVPQYRLQFAAQVISALSIFSHLQTQEKA